MKIYKNARLRNTNQLFDIIVADGIIKDIKPIDGNYYQMAENIDLKGNLVCEPYVESHIHLDYVYTANMPNENETGTLFEGIARWSEAKDSLTINEVKERAMKAIRSQVYSGVQYIRTHVDVTHPKLTALKAMLELKEELKDIVTIQLIAFPQEGMYAYKGGDELVEEALKMGADVVGGIPHFELTREYGEKSIKKAIELACKYNKLVDLHCDETDDEQSRFLEVLAAESYLTGLGDKVTASHTCAMGSYNNAYTFKLFKLLKQSEINFISCPTENIHLQGRYDTYPKRRGLTRIKELTDAGMNVSFAQDSISDPWYPLGTGNLMNILDFGLHIGHLMSCEEIEKGLDFITKNGAKTLHLGEKYYLRPGNKANFIVLDAENEFEAIRERSGIVMSVRDGKILVEKEPAKLIMDCF